MSESPTKKHKSGKHFYQKHAYKSRNKYMEAGMYGYLVTTNFKQRDGVREAYMILNKYNEKLNGDKSEESKEKKEEDDEDDIASQLQSQIEQTKKDTQERSYKFQSG